MRPTRRYRLRTAIAAITLLAIAMEDNANSLGNHRGDANAIAGIRGAPTKINLPRSSRLGTPLNLRNGRRADNGGRADFEFCGPKILRRLSLLADARYACRATKIVLSGRSYTDVSLEHLGELTYLRELTLVDTRITGYAIARLKRQLPSLKVTSSGRFRPGMVVGPLQIRPRIVLRLRLPPGRTPFVNRSQRETNRELQPVIRPSELELMAFELIEL